ncbi:MAG: lysostaphin resistance A-like protein [Terriglobia bacterium]
MSAITWFLLAGLVTLSAAVAFLPRPPADEVARLRAWVYRSIILAEWGLLALFFSLLLLDGRYPAQFGLRLSSSAWREDLLWGGAASMVAIGLGEFWWALERRRGWGGRDFMQALLPRTRREKWLALGLAVTAGYCEEFLYRGFLMTVLDNWLSSVWLAGGISVLLFALAHVPYGKLGVMSALTGGTVLALAFSATGRLAAPVLAHVAYDCYAFFTGRFETFPPRSAGNTDKQG